MGRFTIQTDLGRIKTFDILVKYTAQCIQQLNNIVNGNVELDSNIASQTITVTFKAANSYQLITHNLNKKGLRFFVIDKSTTCDVYHDASQDNVSQIYLACNKATTVTLVLI